MRASMSNLVRAFVLFPWLLLALPAQTPNPLASESAAAAAVPGGWIVAEGRANRAVQAGFPATAAAGYREILAAAGLPVETRQRVTIALATALLDAGELAEAEKILSAYEGPRNAVYQLRVGLLAAAQRRIPPAKLALAAIRAEELPAVDRGWWFYLQALLADAEGNIDRAKGFYEQAKQEAVSALPRARFELAYESSRLRDAPLAEPQLATLRSNMERFAGQDFGYDVARNYAAALSVAGRKTEALAVLQRQLAVLSPSQRKIADQMLLLIGLIAGERSPTGQNALIELLNKAQQAETQRTALALLARGARAPAEREQLRGELGKLIGAPVLHPIIEDLLLVRAQAALADQQYGPADDDARLLLERYPGSPLKSAALGVRLSVAWELKRYRSAADLATQLRGVIPPGRERAELGVLLAEAYFRSGDYQNAADAYDAALREAPQVVPAGVLIFQRVLADIRAGAIDAAAKLLDDTAGNPAFDAVNRWQAEWNLVKEMQVRGLGAAALARVEKLLAQGAQGVPAELRIRLLWLRAKLSFDNGQPEAAMKQVDDLAAALPGAQLDEALRGEVASTAQLLKAQALLALQRDAAAGALLDQLRVDFKASKAAEYSYIVQATNLSERGETVKAQQLLIKLADDHKGSEFAPLALYEASLCAERRGLDDTLREAYRLLERLVQDYPRDELVFYGRLKQGDLLRKLNDFGAARQFYENLINNYGQHPDVLLAQLALADSLFAQGGNSVVNYESASAIYERLRDLPQAPVDLRVEAGYKWGYALAKRGQGAKAATVYWSVVDAFLLEARPAGALGGKGRYWIARTLIGLGQLHEDAGRLDEAQRAYQLILDHKLSGASAQAQAKLARFRVAPPEEAKP
jgi:hypothetical protein